MSVLKSKRTVSPMEFLKNALDLRKQLTEWAMRDFGTKKNVKHIQAGVQGMSEEDITALNGILAKYDRAPRRLQSVYPEWFLLQEIKFIGRQLFELCDNIAHANSVYIVYEVDKNQRREYQNAAIGNCYALKQELQFLIETVGTDVNQLGDITAKIEKEIALLKGWRKADSRRKAGKEMPEDKEENNKG